MNGPFPSRKLSNPACRLPTWLTGRYLPRSQWPAIARFCHAGPSGPLGALRLADSANACWLLLASVVLLAPPVQAERLKDLVTSVQGVRQNQLLGYGLVVGLDGSGDQTTQTPFTVQSVVSMLQQLGVALPAATSACS